MLHTSSHIQSGRKGGLFLSNMIVVLNSLIFVDVTDEVEMLTWVYKFMVFVCLGCLWSSPDFCLVNFKLLASWNSSSILH